MTNIQETPITREEIERRGFADNTPIGRDEVDDRGISDDYPFFYYHQPEWIDNAECYLPITPINSDLEHEISTEKPGKFVICTTFMLAGITIGIRLKRTDGNGFILYSARHHTFGNKTFNDTVNGICKQMHADIRAGIALPYDGYEEDA